MPTIETRQTGLIARIIDNNLNSWEDFAGVDLNIETIYKDTDLEDYPKEWELAWWGYRGQAAMVKRTTDEAIVRVRIGDGTMDDRTIYRQIITDPTDPAEWLNWTQLYTGDHYAVALVRDATAAAGYRVVHSKSDGIYINNVLKISGGATGLRIIRFKVTAREGTRYLYCADVTQDPDGERVMNWYYIPDINAASLTLVADTANYRRYHSDIAVARLDRNAGTWWYRWRSLVLDGGARDKYASEQFTSEAVGSFTTTPSADQFNEWKEFAHLRGPSGQAGFKRMNDMFVTLISTPDLDAQEIASCYFMFYTEQHLDINGNVMSNLRRPVYWMRSADPFSPFWSEPVPVGYSLWGLAGAVEWGEHVYLTGNGRVLRRPLAATEIELTDYIPEGEYELPAENQPGYGTLLCANPDNVLGAQLGLTDATSTGFTDRRLVLAVGRKLPFEDDYTWKQDSSWWVTGLRKTRDGINQRIEVEIGDHWHRLELPFREMISIPGRLVWTDWEPDAPNELFSYSNDTDEFIRSTPVGATPATTPRLRTLVTEVTRSITLFAGWRGENALVRALFWAAGGIVFRYKDADHYYYATATNSTIRLEKYTKDDEDEPAIISELASVPNPVGVPCWLDVDYRWGRIKVLVNFVVVIDYNLVNAGSALQPWTGFAGLIAGSDVGNASYGEISNLRISEFHSARSTRELIRTLLAYAEEHSVSVDTDEDSSAPQINLIWGPQSDLETPAAALRQLLEASRLQIAWRADETTE